MHTYTRTLQLVSSLKSVGVGVVYRIILLFGGYHITRNLSYDTDAKQKLDIYKYISKNEAQLRPVAVVIHGGGWVTGDKRERALFAARLAQQGYIVVNVNYRLAPQHPFPAAITDFLSAIKWIHGHIQAYGGDPGHLVVIGDSAGAHIASLAVADGQSHSRLYGVDAHDALQCIRKLVLYYGIYDLRTVEYVSRPNMRTYLRSFTGTNGEDQFKYSDLASPIHFVKDFPPTLLIVSEVDPLYSQTAELSERMKTNHIQYELLLLDRVNYPATKHGFQSLVWSKGAKAAFARVTKFLDSDQKS